MYDPDTEPKQKQNLHRHELSWGKKHSLRNSFIGSETFPLTLISRHVQLREKIQLLALVAQYRHWWRITGTGGAVCKGATPSVEQ